MAVLGDVIVAGLKFAVGQHTTVAASDTVATGLREVLAAFATLQSAPVVGADRVLADVGNQEGSPAAGSILIKSYKPTAVDNATPAAATTFELVVSWFAVGY